METVAGITSNQKRKEETDESLDEPTAKRLRVSISTDTNVLAVVVIVGAAEEATYEPHPKRRKTSYCTNVNVSIASDTDGYDDNDDDDESFVDDEADATDSKDDNLAVNDDTESTLSSASSSTTEPISSSVMGIAFPTNAPYALQHADIAQSHLRKCTITDIGMPRVAHGLHHTLPLSFPKPVYQASRRRKWERMAVYEDDTATLSGWFERGFTDNGRMPTVNHGILTTADRGQENRQPISQPAVENRYEVAQFLYEDDEHEQEQEVEQMAALVMSDSWPTRDEIYG